MNRSFETFDGQHGLAVLIALALAVLLPAAIRVADSERVAARARIALAIGLAVYLAGGYAIRTLIFAEPWQLHLPLHLCGASIVLGIVMLLRSSYRLYEIVFFWSIGGGIAALATPELQRGFPHPFFLLFFLGHGLAITTALFATFVWGYRPRWRSIGFVIAATGLYGLVMLPVNALLGSNYLYLLRKPTQASLLDLFGEWPWYLPGLALLTLLVILLCYAPFAVYDLTRRRQR